MHPYISQALAAERVRDLRHEASAARLAREARRGRPRARAGRHQPHPNTAPDTYAEFLSLTSGPLMREPAAAGRADGQTVR
jgi:hypothetical protein